MMSALAEIVAPVTEDDFFEHYFTRQHLLVTDRRGDRFEPLFSMADFNENLGWHGRPHPNEIRLARPGNIYHADFGAPAHADRLADRFREGYTININNVDERHPRVRAMVHALVRAFGAGVTAAVYLSPPRERAFPLHFDTHEVFILQISGMKHWRLFSNTIEYPTNTVSTRTVKPEDVGPPLFDGTLEPGDFLYVPRGMVHEAMTETSQSLHMTVGVHLPTRLELLIEILAAEAERNPELRRGLPRGALVSNNIDFGELEVMVRQALAPPRGPIALERMLVRLFEAQVPVGGDRFFDNPPALTEDSWLTRRLGIWPHVITDGLRVTLLFQGGRVDAAFSARAALEMAAETERFQVSELPIASPEGRLALAERLVFAGAFSVG
jgi:lysine-specific demethylase/histidyl-hydroxylase NO66